VAIRITIIMIDDHIPIVLLLLQSRILNWRTVQYTAQQKSSRLIAMYDAHEITACVQTVEYQLATLPTSRASRTRAPIQAAIGSSLMLFFNVILFYFF